MVINISILPLPGSNDGYALYAVIITQVIKSLLFQKKNV